MPLCIPLGGSKRRSSDRKSKYFCVPNPPQKLPGTPKTPVKKGRDENLPSAVTPPPATSVPGTPSTVGNSTSSARISPLTVCTLLDTPPSSPSSSPPEVRAFAPTSFSGKKSTPSSSESVSQSVSNSTATVSTAFTQSSSLSTASLRSTVTTTSFSYVCVSSSLGGVVAYDDDAIVPPVFPATRTESKGKDECKGTKDTAKDTNVDSVNVTKSDDFVDVGRTNDTAEGDTPEGDRASDRDDIVPCPNEGDGAADAPVRDAGEVEDAGDDDTSSISGCPPRTWSGTVDPAHGGAHMQLTSDGRAHLQLPLTGRRDRAAHAVPVESSKPAARVLYASMWSRADGKPEVQDIRRSGGWEHDGGASFMVRTENGEGDKDDGGSDSTGEIVDGKFEI